MSIEVDLSPPAPSPPQAVPRDRTFMHLLYAMHTIAWASMGTLAVIAVILNYVRRPDETDPIFRAHHAYMISTFWWTLLWLALSSVLWLLVAPGAIAWTVIGLWYLYRCLRGWLRFNDGRSPQEVPAP